MSVITWLRELVLGRNGYIAEEQDEEIQQIKDESQSSLDKATVHLAQMREEFTKLKRKDSPGEEPA